MNLRHRAIACGLVATLAFGAFAPVALASPQSELAEVSAQLETYGAELEELQGDLATKTTELEDTEYKIGEKQANIKTTTEELANAKAVLGARMRSSYKSGTSSLLGVILGADSIDDIVSRIYYMDKVAQSDAEAIEEVRTLEDRLKSEMKDLENTKKNQEKAVDELQTQVDEYSAKVSEARSYYEALDAQVQAELAAQQEAEENARIQAALDAAEEQQRQEETVAQREQELEQQTDTEEEPAPTTQQPAEDDDDDDSGATQTPTPSKTVAGGAGLGTAYAAIGCPYVMGAAGPSSFDCSGLVCYCYGWGRGRTTYDMIASLKSTGSWKTSMDQLSPGDLVFPSTGHVGIYTGGGMMIHAPTPGRTVCEAPVYAFIGGGTF